MNTKLSQVQAAKAAGVSRVTIYRAIKSGRLSVERGENGSTHIDASELLRVFPDASLEHAQERAQDGATSTTEHAPEQGELIALRAMLEEVKTDKLHLRAELERAATERAQFLSLLRERDQTIKEKDRQLAEQMETVRLITDQRTKKKSWWRRLW